MGAARGLEGRFFRSVIPVRGLQEGVDFYASLLDTEGEAVSPGRVYFDLGEGVLCIYDAQSDGDAEIPAPLSVPVYIATPHLEEQYARARALLGDSAGSIASRPWGEISFYLVDPFGNQICFVDDRTTFRGGAFIE